jgi:hypothetical protein
MASMSEVVVQCLNAALSPVNEHRLQAEQQLSQLEAQGGIPFGTMYNNLLKGFGVVLAQIALDRNLPIPIRQVSL